MRLLVVLALVGAALAAPSPLTEEQNLWELFKGAFDKSYASEEVEAVRMNIFLDNKRVIEEHNERFNAGEVSFEMGINKFSDLTVSEWSKIYNGYKAPEGAESLGRAWEEPADLQDPLPDKIDWRLHDMVTPVKNQGQCGSCWAFSSTGALEGQHSRQAGELVSLSESNLVDCTAKYGNGGCNGGWQDNAYKYIVDVGGIDTEESYPYQPVQRTCAFDAANVGANATGYVSIPTGDEDALKKAVATYGPVAVAIDATQQDFMNYRSGVYYSTACSPTNLDHAVLVVGYDTDATRNLDYWIVKNSWDTNWGNEGYIWMARGYNNMCGIATHALYPTVAW